MRTDDFPQATITFDDGRNARVLVEIFRVEPGSVIAADSQRATSVELAGLAISADSSFEDWVAASLEDSRLFNATDDPALAAEMGTMDARFSELAERRAMRRDKRKLVEKAPALGSPGETLKDASVTAVGSKEMTAFLDITLPDGEQRSLFIILMDGGAVPSTLNIAARASRGVPSFVEITRGIPDVYDDEHLALEVSGAVYMGLRHRAERMGITVPELLSDVADKSNRAPNSRRDEP